MLVPKVRIGDLATRHFHFQPLSKNKWLRSSEFEGVTFLIRIAILEERKWMETSLADEPVCRRG